MVIKNSEGRILAVVAEYRNESNARAAALATKAGVVVLGDCDEDGGMFWVTTNREASRLVKAGYEMAQ